MRKVDFALFYEHQQRELFGLQALHAELVSRGYTVEVRDSSCVYPEKRALDPLDFEPEVVVYPWLYDDNHVRRAQTIPGKRLKIVNLQSEQIYSDYGKAHGWNTIRENAVNAYHVAWGDRSEEKYRSWGIDPDRIWKVGSIHLDLCAPTFDGAFASREEVAARYRLDPAKQWAIFFSSFGATELSQDELDHWEKNLVGFTEFKNLAKKSKSSICEWLLRYCDDNPDVEIIYRPHPSEYASRDKVLPRLAETIPNFHYIWDGPAIQWTKVCDKILTWISTAMSDAYFAGKSFAILRPVEVDPYYELEMFTDGSFVTSYEDFDLFMSDPAPRLPIAPEAFSAYYENANGELACRLLADKLGELLTEETGDPFSQVAPPEDFLADLSLIPAPQDWIDVMPMLIPQEHQREKDVFERVSRALASQ